MNDPVDPEPQHPAGMLHTLIILRHAHAQYSHNGSDRERPLTTEGEKTALSRGRELNSQISAIDRVLVSTAVRTRQTTSLALTYGPDPTFLDEIYDASAGKLVRVLENHASGCTVLVGHNPGLSDLASMLCGKPEVLRPGDLVVVTFNPPASQPLQWSCGQISQRFQSA